MCGQKNQLLGLAAQIKGHPQDELDIYQEFAVADMLPLADAILQTVHACDFREVLVKAIHGGHKNKSVNIIKVGAPGVSL